jgi:hypothetical protein
MLEKKLVSQLLSIKLRRLREILVTGCPLKQVHMRSALAFLQLSFLTYLVLLQKECDK